MRLERDQINTLIVAVLMAGAFVFGLWLPRRMDERRLRERIEVAEQQMGLERGTDHELTRLAHEVNELQRIVDTTEKHVPESSELAGLLRSLSTELNAQSVTDEEIVTQPIVEGRDYSVIPMTLAFRGSFSDVFGFLRETESMRRLIRVNQLKVTGVDNAPGGDLEVRLELCSFFVPVKEDEK